jgi:tRNA A37 threonylcarbamoyladenosine biosynthesis protein TsaE
MSTKFSEFIKANFPDGSVPAGLASVEYSRTLSDREEIITEIFDALAGEESKIIALNGTFGAGKTGLLKSIVSLLEHYANVLL